MNRNLQSGSENNKKLHRSYWQSNKPCFSWFWLKYLQVYRKSLPSFVVGQKCSQETENIFYLKLTIYMYIITSAHTCLIFAIPQEEFVWKSYDGDK